jgi:hypothetical protein
MVTSESADKMISKYPDRIPVIIRTNNRNIVLDKKKFLVPRDMSCASLMYVIRKHINLNSSEALFLFCDNTLVAGYVPVYDIYENYLIKHTNGDKFLYLDISTENTFGV